MPTPLSQTLYLQFLQQLLNTIQVNGEPQALSPAQIWDWGGTQGSMAGATWPQYLALNQIPSEPVTGSQSWTTASGFDTTYLSWLQAALNPIPRQNDPEYVSLQTAVRNATIDVQSAYTSANTQFQNYVQATSSTQTQQQWLQGAGAAYQASITTANNAWTTASNALSAYVASKSTSVSGAVTAYNSGVSSITNPATNQPSKVGAWTTSEAAYDYVNKITRNNPGGPATLGNAQSFSQTAGSNVYDYQHKWAEGEFALPLDFFLGWGEASWSSTDTSNFNSDYTLTFSFGDLSLVQAAPGTWFTPGIVAVMGKNGPYNEGYSGFRAGQNTYFFGPGGVLQRLISGMIVAYQPKVTIQAGQSFAQNLQSHWQATGGLMVGPFFFGAAGGGNSEHDTFDMSSGTVTLQNKGAWPYIIAMVTNWVLTPPSPGLAAAPTPARRVART